jgi:hypothetical protein
LIYFILGHYTRHETARHLIDSSATAQRVEGDDTSNRRPPAGGWNRLKEGRMLSSAVAPHDHRRSTFALLGVALAAALLVLVVVATPAKAHAASTQAKAASATVRLVGVRTTLTTDPATTGLLFGAGIIPLPVSPTAVSPTAHAARYSFPVTGGMVDAKTLAGSIRHSGGLLLAHYTTPTTMPTSWKALSLTKFTIRITGSPNLTAVVNGGARAEIASLDLSKATIVRFRHHGRAYVSISNVAVALNSTAVGAINSTFGTSLSAPVDLGTANVLVKVAR